MKVHIVNGHSGICSSDELHWDVMGFVSEEKAIELCNNCNHESQWIYLSAGRDFYKANQVKSQYDPNMKHLDGPARYYITQLEVDTEE